MFTVDGGTQALRRTMAYVIDIASGTCKMPPCSLRASLIMRLNLAGWQVATGSESGISKMRCPTHVIPPGSGLTSHTGRQDRTPFGSLPRQRDDPRTHSLKQTNRTGYPQIVRL